MNHPYTKKDVLDFLRSQFIMQLATCNNNKPAASVVVYSIDDNFHFYFTTHQDSHKALNLVSNPYISLAIWEPQHMLVQADGVARVCEDVEKKEVVLDRLADAATSDKNFWPPVFRITGNNYVVFEVVLSWLRVLDLTQNTVRQSDSPFVDIPLS